MQGGVWKNRDFRPIYRFISEMIQDRAIVTANKKPYPSFRLVPLSMTLSDLEWLSDVFNDSKHRAVSLRQRNLLLPMQIYVKLKVCALAIAPLAWVRLVTSSALQSQNWQLIGMSQWCRSALCGHPLPALTDSWTHDAASRNHHPNQPQ